MTVTQWTSIFVALVFALPSASAFWVGLDLNFKLRSTIRVTLPDELDPRVYRFNYSIGPSYAVTWTIRNPRNPRNVPEIPEECRFYRHKADNLLLYGPADPLVMDEHRYTTIELSDYRRVGEGSYICLEDIRRGTGGVYSGPEIDEVMHPVPDGCVRLGVEPISTGFGLRMELDNLQSQVRLYYRELVRNRFDVAYPGSDIFGICETIYRTIHPLPGVPTCARAINLLSSNQTILVSVQVGISIAALLALGGYEIIIEMFRRELLRRNAVGSSSSSREGQHPPT